MRNARARAITADGKPIFPEKEEHKTVARWLFINGIFFIHVPNEIPNLRKGKRTQEDIGNRVQWYRQQKQMGLRPGASDFIIFDPPPAYPDKKGAVMELKALDGGNPSPEQYEFLSEMGARRWANSWWRGSDAAIKWLESLGYGKEVKP